MELNAGADDVDGGGNANFSKAKSCVPMGYLGQKAVVHPTISKALQDAIDDRNLLLKAAATGKFEPKSATTDDDAKKPQDVFLRAASAPDALVAKYGSKLTVKRDASTFQKDKSLN